MIDAHRPPLRLANLGEHAISKRRVASSKRPTDHVSVQMWAVTILATFSLVSCSTAVGQTSEDIQATAEISADDYISKYQARLRIKTESPLLEDENSALEGLSGRFGEPAKSLLTETAQVDSGSRAVLMELLKKNYGNYARSLEQPKERIKEELKRVRNEWREVRTSLNASAIRAGTEQPVQQSQGVLANLIHERNRWIWLAGLWLVAVMTVVIAIDRRHAIRRLGWVRRVESLGLKVALGLIVGLPLLGTLGAFFFGQMLIGSLMPEGNPEVKLPDDIARPIAELEQELVRDGLTESHEELKTVNKELREGWLKKLDDDDRALATSWLDSRARIREAAVDINLQAAFAKQLKTDLTALEAAQTSSDTEKVDPAELASKQKWTGVGLGASFMLLSSGVGFVFYRRSKAHEAERERTCPRCLATGTLVPNVDETTGASRGRLGLEEYRCTNVIMEAPYQECEFVFASEYRTRRKLGFPTLGVAESGKTHWLAMAYRELNQGRFPECVSFERIRSEAAEQFDRTVEQILDARIGTTATITNRLPDPLTFGFRDNDSLGCSHVLASVSDYGGQVTTDVDSFYRRRALEADGYFFFLDPTKPSEKQALALTDFREDLRLMQGLQQGKQINRPVALCVSKLDLMVNMPYAEETNEILDFYTELGDVDASFGQLSMKLLEKRSQLMESIRDTIWPGWNIEHQIKDLFGGRYLFFPLTPVGMNEPGETDLNQRVIEPYGILEPLLWLLHMNGYPVLD